jgi:DNA-binding protein H-NS
MILLHTASQVGDLNITSTDLRSQLNQLRQNSLSLSEQLNTLEQEVKAKKEERERQGSKNMAQVQTELIKLKRELEVSSLGNG